MCAREQIATLRPKPAGNFVVQAEDADRLLAVAEEGGHSDSSAGEDTPEIAHHYERLRRWARPGGTWPAADQEICRPEMVDWR